MNEQETLRNEALKSILKQIIQTNPNLTDFQKQMAMDIIDRAAQQADWIINMMRMCGFLK